MKRSCLIIFLAGLALGFRPGPRPSLPNVIWDSRPDSITGITAMIEERGDSFHIEERIFFSSERAGTLSIFAPHASGLSIVFNGVETDSIAKDRYALEGGKGCIEIKGMISTEYAVSRGMTRWERTNQFALTCPVKWLKGESLSGGDRISEKDIVAVFIMLDLEGFRTMQTDESEGKRVGNRVIHVFEEPDILFSGERIEKKSSKSPAIEGLERMEKE